MQILDSLRGDVLVLEVKGRLDNQSTQELEEKVLAGLEDGRQALLVDCGGLDYINSSGLRVLVMAYQRLKGSGGRFAVCGLKDYIKEIFEISGYDQLFLLFPDQERALAELGAA